MSLSCHGQVTDDEICNGTTDPEQECESEEEGETALPLQLLYLHTIRKFMENAGADFSYLYTLDSQVLQVALSKTSQTSIPDFFSLCSPEY